MLKFNISDGALHHNTDLMHSLPKVAPSVPVFIISTSEGTPFPSIIHSCRQDTVMKMLAQIFKIANKSNKSNHEVFLTAVVVLQELQNIRYSVRR